MLRDRPARKIAQGFGGETQKALILAFSIRLSVKRRKKMRNGIMGQVKKLSPDAQALVATLAKTHHLERKEYAKLWRSPIAVSVAELCVQGFLVPLLGGNKTRVYWLPSSCMAEDIQQALQLVPPVSPKVQRKVNDELRRVGFDTQS